MGDYSYANQFMGYANSYKNAMEKLPGAFDNLSTTVTRINSDISSFAIPDDYLGSKVSESLDKITQEIGKINENVVSMKDGSVTFATNMYNYYKEKYDAEITKIESTDESL